MHTDRGAVTMQDCKTKYAKSLKNKTSFEYGFDFSNSVVVQSFHHVNC